MYQPPDLDELKRRCDEVKDFYDDLNVKLVRPAGDMLGLHSEFLPASKRYINDYVQYVKSDFLAGSWLRSDPAVRRKYRYLYRLFRGHRKKRLFTAVPCFTGYQGDSHQCFGVCLCRFAGRCGSHSVIILSSTYSVLFGGAGGHSRP